MDAIALLQYACQLFLFGIAGYFVIAMIAMPEWAIRLCQACWIILCVLSMAGALLAGEPRKPVGRLSPIPPGPASIIR